VTAEYSINTIGVYATVGTAAEQLFAVITAQEADKMPAFNSRPYSYIYDMNMTMQGTANITVTVNNAGFVNINDLNNALDGVNDSITNLDETVNGRIDTLSSSVDTRIGALNDAIASVNDALPHDVNYTASSTGTIHITVPSSSRHFIIVHSGTATRYYVAYVMCSSTGSVFVGEVIKGSSITNVDTATANRLKLTAGGNASVYDIVLNGSSIS
jgi:ACT domain-containing protein